MSAEKFPKLSEAQKGFIAVDGRSLGEIEAGRRGEITEKIKESRKERDKELAEAKTFGNRVKDFFGAGIRRTAESRAAYTNERLHDSLKHKHYQLNEGLKKERRMIIAQTIQDPLREFADLCRERNGMRNIHPDILKMTEEEVDARRLELRVKEEKIKQQLKPENIALGIQEPAARDDVIYEVANFLKYNNYDLFASIEKPNAYDMEGAKGIPIDVARAVIEGVAASVESSGADSIEDAPRIFETIENATRFCPDALTEKNRKALAELMLTKGILLPFHKLSSCGNYIDMVAADAEGAELSTMLENKLDESFAKKEWFQINAACSSFSEILSAKALSKLDQYLQKFNIALADVGLAWNFPSGGKAGWQNLEANMPKIEALEAQRPGIIKTLFSEYGIKEFHRYPNEVLIEQFDKKDENLPYGTLLYSNHDHNQAFDTDVATVKKVFEDLKSGGYGLRVGEFDSPFALMKSLAKFNGRYGAHEKMSFMILGAHGSEQGFSASYTKSVESEDLQGEGVQKMKDFFVPEPEIVLASCSTGAEGGLGQKLSDAYQARVHAPGVPTSLKSIETYFSEDGRPKFKVNYADNALRTYSRGVKGD